MTLEWKDGLLMIAIVMNLASTALNFWVTARVRRRLQQNNQAAARAVGFTLFVATARDVPEGLRGLARNALPPEFTLPPEDEERVH
jgi:hypothetical protein